MPSGISTSMWAFVLEPHPSRLLCVGVFRIQYTATLSSTCLVLVALLEGF